MRKGLQHVPLLHAKDPRLAMVHKITKLMDEQFSLGRFKFGLDPVLNFIPVVGDVGSYIISISLIITMMRYGASSKVAFKMLMNATIDAFVGAVPFLGWVFDFVYKANTRNVKLLTEHYTENKHTGSAAPFIVLILLVMLLLLGLFIYVVFKLLDWILMPLMH